MHLKSPLLFTALTVLLFSITTTAASSTTLVDAKLQSKSFSPAVGTCGLKRFSLESFTHVISDSKTSDTYRMTSTLYAIETNAPECIRDYGIVQFIRGCVYGLSYKLKTGEEFNRDFSVVRDIRGKSNRTFVHPEWAVDSDIADPLYGTADPSEGLNLEIDRLAYYLIPKSPLKLTSSRKDLIADYTTINDPTNSTYTLKNYEMPTSILLTGDSPALGGYTVDPESGTADVQNTSLEFQTCIYHMKDIPTQGDPAAPGIAEALGGPITCLNWENKNTFNFKKKKFEDHAFTGIDPFCSTYTGKD